MQATRARNIFHFPTSPRSGQWQYEVTTPRGGGIQTPGLKVHTYYLVSRQYLPGGRDYNNA